jgi:hypothetical protein
MLLKYLKIQDISDLKKNDLAFARVSLNSVVKWIKTLVVLACLSLIVAPWAEIVPLLVAQGITTFLGVVYEAFYVPLAAALNPEIANLILFIVAPASIVVVFISFWSIIRRSMRGLRKLVQTE